MGIRDKVGRPKRRWPCRTKDDDGREVVLSKKVWEHIVAHHCNVTLEMVELALADPHLKQISETNRMRVSYCHFLPGCKLYIMVVTDRSSDPASVCTAFLTKKPKKGEILRVRKPDSIV